MAMDGLRGYIQLASGLAETSRAKATEAASALLALTGALSSARSGKDVQIQVQDLAEELLAAAAANRRSLIALVRSEVERAMARAPIPPDELDRARAAVAKLSADVEELRAQVMTNPAVGEVAARLGLAGHTVTRPAADPFATDDAAVVVDTAFTEPAEPPTPAPPRRRPPRKQIAAQAGTRPVPAAAGSDAGQESAEPRTGTGATKAAPATKTTATKTATKKAATTKTAAAKKAAATKAAAAKKAAATKTTAKKTAATKTTVKKTAATKTTVKKTAPKKASATTATAKKTTAKKAPAKKATTSAAKRAPRSGGSGGSST